MSANQDHFLCSLISLNYHQPKRSKKNPNIQKILPTNSKIIPDIFLIFLSKNLQNIANRQPVGYSTNQPLYGILLWGGLGISLGSNFLNFFSPLQEILFLDQFLVGMVCCGSRVIETMGSRISKMTPR